MLDDGGCDNDLMIGENVNPEEVRAELTLQPDEWIFLQQYEGGMDPIYQLITFMQNKRTIAHEELLVLMGCLEKLASKFFLTWEDVSKDADNENLGDRQMNICVLELFLSINRWINKMRTKPSCYVVGYASGKWE